MVDQKFHLLYNSSIVNNKDMYDTTGPVRKTVGMEHT